MTSYLQITKNAREAGDWDKARAIHVAAAGLEKYSSRKDHPAIIQAGQSKVGEKYLTVGLYYAIVIRKINKIEGLGTLTSVSITSELEPGRGVVISPGTDLIPYSDEWHFYKKQKIDQEGSEVVAKKGAKSSNPPVHEKKISWSSAVDTLLFEKPAEEKPDFHGIADNILQSGVLGANVDKKRLIQLIHTRYWRYKNGVIGLHTPKESV